MSRMEHKFVRAIFPGSFDPITNGHLDVVKRAMRLFDELIIAVGRSPVKNQLFTPEERVEMIAELITDLPGVRVESFDGLTVEYAARTKADVILRGLRSLTDVQYEFQLAMTNRAVAGIETVFIMTSEQYGFTSSTLIREIASLGGDLSNLIPPSVQKRLEARFSKLPRHATADDLRV
jgi:pantetheine-phosphate adenylyltransferase